MSGLVWAASHTYELLGTRFRVRVDEPGLIDGLDRLLAPFRAEDDLPVRARNDYAVVDGRRVPGRGEGLIVYRDCSPIGTARTVDASISTLLPALNRSAVEQTRHFAAHAGVVAANGVVVALPAQSEHGKSTLTGAAVIAGFEYGSDEAVCIDGSNDEVIPYPKPLGLSSWSRRVLGIDDAGLAFIPGAMEGYVTAEDLGGRHVERLGGLDHVVISEFGSPTLELEETSGTEAMRVLLEMSFNHFKFGAEAFHLTARVANGARAWRLRYDDPIAAGRLLMERLVD